MKKKKIRIFHQFLTTKNLCLIFTTILLFCFGTAHSVLSESVLAKGTASLKVDPGLENIETFVDSWYDNGIYHHGIFVTLTNRLNYDLSGWNLSMDVPNDAKIERAVDTVTWIENTTIFISNGPMNGYIKKGGTVSFVFQFSTLQTTYQPTNLFFYGEKATTTFSPNPEQSNTSKEEPNVSSLSAKDFSVRFELLDEWEKEQRFYKEYKVHILNSSDLSCDSWSFELVHPMPYQMEKLWNASSSFINSTLTHIQNTNFNGMIDPNSEIDFSFVASFPVENSSSFSFQNLIIK